MNKKIFVVIFILLLVIAFFLISKNVVSVPGILVSPGIEKASSQAVVTPAPTLAPPNAPQEVKYDASTDLKQELESINPQVLDSDF